MTPRLLGGQQLVDGHDLELRQLDRYIETLRHAGQSSHPDCGP
jgi:hypothetical protein